MNLNLTDIAKIVQGSPIIGALATTNGDCDYVSMKNFDRCTIILTVDNAATVTGAAITLKQATDVAGTGEKALPFAAMLANVDTGAGDALTETAVTSDTFTTATTDNKNLMYVIEVKAEDLDVAGGFDCLRVDALLMANAVGSVLYIMHGARNCPPGSAIVD
ncbi:MAG: hypothetical protein U0932_14570 [Thiobacillus sp.]|nr:hypothetical protein [Thiobacillus sp.]